jgi:hypothetical protein
MQSGWEISNQHPGTSNQHLYVTGSKVAECTKTRQFEAELRYILYLSATIRSTSSSVGMVSR